MKRISLLLIGACLAAFMAYGQIEQTSPELCGKPGETVPVPSGVTARDIRNASSELTVTRSAKSTTIPLYGIGEVKQVCTLPGDRLAVFVYDSGSGVYTVLLIEGETVVERVMTEEGIISPDQHWLAYRVFHAIHADMPPSEEYLLYDLTQPPAANTHKAADPNDGTMAHGVVIYPVVPQQAPFDSYDLPEEMRHTGGGIFWAADSKSLVFFDKVNGARNVVWVRIQDSGHTAAFVRPLAAEDLSVTPPTGWPADAGFHCGISNAEVRVGNYNEPEVVLEFGKGEPGAECPSKPLVIPAAEFKPAPMENLPPAPQKKPSHGIRIDR